MKRLCLFACVLLVITAQAQVKLENIVKPGTKLIYAVTANGNEYNFIVTVNNLKGTSFSWQMTAPANIAGSITHTAKALASANAMYNFFEPGDKKLDDQSLSVWISQRCFNQFDKHTGKPITMYLDGPGKDAQDMGTYTGSLPLEVTIDGKTDTIYEELVKPLIMTGNGYSPSEENEDFFTFYGSASFPIILRMRLSFSIVLKEIQTK
ncbi:MAG TPA: hypothetical protein VG738_05080 [Chitinophagaceae bacterium]|nr:hypothetical protein [Chitinophagaceae bacterium]